MGYKPKIVVVHTGGIRVVEAQNSGSLYSPISDDYPTAHDAVDADSVDNDYSIWVEQFGRHFAAWQANYSYPVSTRVEPTTPNGYYYQTVFAGISAGIEPVWPIIIGATVDDGTTKWECHEATVHWVYRGGIILSVPSGLTVISASIFLYGEDLYVGGDGDDDIIIVSGADLADTLVVADFGDLLDEVTSFGSINTASWVLEGWNEIALNAAGLAALQAAISGGDKFRVGVRMGRDISVTDPADQTYAIAYGSNGDSSLPSPCSGNASAPLLAMGAI